MEPYVTRTLAQYDLIPRGAHVLVALSGGRDSVCLLHKLLCLQKDYDWRITAAHFDHGIRQESASDAQFVRDLCRDWGVECVTQRGDVPEFRQRHKLSMEDAARRLRYEFLKKTAQTVGADVIALAHHAGDQTETMLLHLLRGSGLAGAAGMQPARDGFVRPMLAVPTHEVQAYFDRHQLRCVQDATNLDLSNPRNALRHRVLPELERIAPAAQAAFARAAVNLREDEQALWALARESLRDLRKDFGGYSAEMIESPYPALTHRSIRILAEAAGLRQDLSREAVLSVAQMVREGRGRVDLPHGCTGRMYRGRLWIGKKQESLPSVPAQDTMNWGQYRLSRKSLPHAPEDYDRQKRFAQFFAALPQDAVLRGMRSGDRVRLASGSKSLGDYWTDAHVPPWRRESLPVLASGKQILWIPHTGYADPDLFVQNPVEPVEYLWIQEEEQP